MVEPKVKNLTEYNNLNNQIKSFFKDSIANILLKDSSLTLRQYETLIIELILENNPDDKTIYRNKTLFITNNVSGGSFRRTLSQARRNIISSIYTILLLNYIGFFNGPPFDDYQILGEKLRNYVEATRSSDDKNAKKLLFNIERELAEWIAKLAAPKSLKVM